MTDVQARWAWTLIEALARAGVRDVVLSPGSRSTPFVIAAARHPDLACHDVFDERSAGFFAIGQARATGRPSILLCTSGTAAAHYYPAVIEAAQAFVPLVVLSADRPFELQHCGANQTVDQTHLFGAHVRHFADVGPPADSDRALAALRRTAVQAVAVASSPTPGPVHLNLHASKPLEPSLPSEGAEPAGGVVGSASRVYGAPLAPSPTAVQDLADLLASTDRGVIVAGPAPLAAVDTREAVFALARRTGWPLCAEATSQLRFARTTDVPRFDAFDWVWRSEGGRARARPDAVLQLGAPPTSGGFERLVSDRTVRRFVVAPHGWPDPTSTAEAMLSCDVDLTVRAVLDALGEGRPAHGDFAHTLTELDALVWGTVASELQAPELSEARVAADVVRACDQRALLMVGNSLPVRHLDAWVRGGDRDVSVASQRGASGIDGLISGAAGLAHGADQPTVLLVGDVSFLHDVNGLAAARHVKGPLVVVVLHNGGGRIFDQLPLGARDDLRAHMPHFTTPHGAALEHAAGLYGHRHVRVDAPSALRSALASAVGTEGTTVLEAVVPPDGAAAQRQRVAGALVEARQD
ncbi:MAG: 2-succinyl-5-enolpyruvyl-6-hydroxy-3-cyclohexene-1-carboxylic-acid synthase [Myxococcota bacterium]